MTRVGDLQCSGVALGRGRGVSEGSGLLMDGMWHCGWEYKNRMCARVNLQTQRVPFLCTLVTPFLPSNS